MTDQFWTTGRDVDGYLIGEGDDILEDTEVIKRLYKLAEYENDETFRRRADAQNIKTLIQALERVDKVIGELSYVGPAHDYMGNDLDDYVIVEQQKIQAVMDFTTEEIWS